MKPHRPIVIIATTAALLLAACGGGAAAGSASGQSRLSTNYADALPVAGQLAAGTLKLEGSAAAVDAQQAAELLPLWQGLSSLLTSSTSSDVEIQGVLAQIEATMTADQVAAISAMRITQSDLSALIQDGPTVGDSGATSGQIQATRRASSGSNLGPGGGFGPGGGGEGIFIGGGPGGSSAGLPGASSGIPQASGSADQQSPALASQDQYGALGVDPITVRVVIQYLAAKAG